MLATGRLIGEGFDDPRLDTLLLAMPIAWKSTVVQYAGRLHREHPGKHEAIVYDDVDAELPVLRRMYAKRLKAYRTLLGTGRGRLNTEPLTVPRREVGWNRWLDENAVFASSRHSVADLSSVAPGTIRRSAAS